MSDGSKARYAQTMSDGTTAQLEEFATRWQDDGIGVHRATAALDERQDGEPVTRLKLLVSDPAGETWDVAAVRELRYALGRRAAELGLPPVSLTLVPEAESEAFSSAT
jgi:hypothetical protein